MNAVLPRDQARAAAKTSAISQLNERSRDIFRRIVESYFETGEPVGSRTLSRKLGQSLSPATIRNVMADLQDAGLLYSPHTSAGRLPTEQGLRLFVDGLLEVGQLTEEERARIDGQCAAAGKSLTQMLEQATTVLSGLAHCAGLVLAPKSDAALKHIEFVSLAPGRALAVLVTEDGLVENRVIDVPPGLPPSGLVQAANYLNARIMGRTIGETRVAILEELTQSRAELDELTAKVVQAGLATWAGDQPDGGGHLIVRGQARLLEDVTAIDELERIRLLFEALETRETVIRLLDSAGGAAGVQIFIGASNELFNLAGCTAIIAPYANSREQIVGAIGVIGPTRLNYARIIPMVDYTARAIGKLIG
jgi:heat-inducible transcriptional repressor